MINHLNFLIINQNVIIKFSITAMPLKCNTKYIQLLEPYQRQHDDAFHSKPIAVAVVHS